MVAQFLSIQQHLVLPLNWLMKTESCAVNLCKISQVPSTSALNPPLALSHCLTINKDFTWGLFIHGKKVDANTCTALKSVPALLQSNSVQPLLETVDTLNVCIGNPDNNFVELCGSHKGSILSPDGSVSAFKDCSIEGQFTVRTSKCELLVGGTKCDYCKKYRSVLCVMCSHQRKSFSSSERSDVSSHVNYRYLSTPEKSKRMANLRAELSQQKRKDLGRIAQGESEKADRSVWCRS